MFAALPMYDHPGVRVATDAFWAEVRDRLRATGIAAPDSLTRSDDLFAQWRSRDLLLGQVCGLPFRTEMHEKVTLLGAIDYDLPDTPPGYYHSHFVARKNDARGTLAEFEGALLAFNEAASHSGWATAAFAPVRFRLGPETGSHRESVRAVAEGRVDIAAIDAISWRLLAAHTDLTDGLKIVGRSAASPGQALITAFPEAAPALRAAIAEGIAHLAPEHRAALGMAGLVALTPEEYLAVPNPPTPEAYGA
ncbi:phosphate/phosphite/phosphonate ABC transporter substrate-binding protein [Tropicimonas isoalkanivorans]|uniref:ABC-type phosphate/phosphonate transport system, substrate-binding protein n=1 Tax=Tropicimonas isoalkanivorans TaxID=441112 RepID=A0A1I1JU56_9RHOB|nr:PhnD/SsuA/transferrin family substrate-binding protein [Tropicimonas isoalkanivorans]SFC48910.1 ABC-type phosphate/phosphonate transport system, substrate-binding protein [Tropicimonas isoalkanivorans]